MELKFELEMGLAWARNKSKRAVCVCSRAPCKRFFTKVQNVFRVVPQPHPALPAPPPPTHIKMCINRNWLSGKYGDKVFKVTIKIARLCSLLDPNTAMTRIRNIRAGAGVGREGKSEKSTGYSCAYVSSWAELSWAEADSSTLFRLKQTVYSSTLPSLRKQKGNQFRFSVSFLFFVSLLTTHTLTD